MKLDINIGFDSEAEYMKISHYAFRYARKKLVNEKVWSYETCTEKARDMVTDSIIEYLKKVAKGSIILEKRSYIMKSIARMLISPKLIKEKERMRQLIIVHNSTDEDIDKSSFTKWVIDSENIPDEYPEDYSQYYFNIKGSSNSNLSEVEILIKNLKDQGFKNREVANKLNISEGQISKLVKKILTKITRKNWV